MSQNHVVPPGGTAALDALLLPFSISISNSGVLYGAVQLQLIQQMDLLEALGPQHYASQPVTPGQDGKRCSEGTIVPGPPPRDPW